MMINKSSDVLPKAQTPMSKLMEEGNRRENDGSAQHNREAVFSIKEKRSHQKQHYSQSTRSPSQQL